MGAKMEAEKILAAWLSALIAGGLLVAPALAKPLNEYPAFLAVDGQLDAYVVVGEDAAPSDVVAAVDLAVSLASVSVVEKVIPGVEVEKVEGKLKEVAFDSALNAAGNFGSTLSWRQLPQLKDTTVMFRGEEYRYVETLTVPSWQVKIKEPTDASDYYYLDVPTAPSLIYKLEFKKDFEAGANVSIDTPLEISILGKLFRITDIDATANSFKALIGEKATFTEIGQTLTIAGKSITLKLAKDGAWATFEVDGAAITIDEGDTKVVDDFKITLISVRVAEVPAGAVTAEIVAGTETEVTYSSGDEFPGETEWKFYGLSFSADDTIRAGDTIQVRYEPAEAVEVLEGGKVSLPGDVLDIEYLGTTATSWIDVTIKPGATITVYDQASPDTKVASGDSLELTSTGKYVFSYPAFGIDEYDKVAIVRNDTNKYVLAYYDTIEDKWLNLTGVVDLNNTAAPDGGRVAITIGLTNGEGMFNLTIYEWNMISGHNPERDGSVMIKVFPKTDASQNITYEFNYTTTDKFKLGVTKGEAEAADVKILDVNKGTWEYDKKIASGIVIYDPEANAVGDTAKFALPDVAAADFKNKIAIGKVEVEVAPEQKVKEYVPITQPVALLDTEVTDAHKAKNLILVGGPAVNRLTADVWGLLYPTYAPEQIPEDKAVIEVIDDFYTAGKVVVVVAGWEAGNTRAACAVLQKFETELKDITAAKIIVGGTSYETATVEQVVTE